MSKEYDLYLNEHKENVIRGFRWLQEHMPEKIGWLNGTPYNVDLEHQICFGHDSSKDNLDEYEAYDRYFYGNNGLSDKSFESVINFNYAWNLHIHRNPHHWQYWVLISDDPENGIKTLDMPRQYIIEMICDWWSFSWKTGNLFEIFDWYEKRKNYIQLSSSTRKYLEDILNSMKGILKNEKNN